MAAASSRFCVGRRGFPVSLGEAGRCTKKKGKQTTTSPTSKEEIAQQLRRGFEETQALAERVASVRRNLATTSWDTAAEHFACPLMDVYGKLKH